MMVMTNMSSPKSGVARCSVDPNACNDLAWGNSEGYLCGVVLHHIIQDQEIAGVTIPTTTIGAYPKLADAPVPMWNNMGKQRRAAPTMVYDAMVDDQSAEAEAKRTLDRMTMDAVHEQVDCGITVPTDGEIRREHYVYYHCSMCKGSTSATLVNKQCAMEVGWQVSPRSYQNWNRGLLFCLPTGVLHSRPQIAR